MIWKLHMRGSIGERKATASSISHVEVKTVYILVDLPVLNDCWMACFSDGVANVAWPDKPQWVSEATPTKAC
jgi:hypothetical protein